MSKPTTEYRCTCGAHLDMRRVEAGLYAQCKRCGTEHLVSCGGPHYSCGFESDKPNKRLEVRS